MVDVGNDGDISNVICHSCKVILPAILKLGWKGRGDSLILRKLQSRITNRGSLCPRVGTRHLFCNDLDTLVNRALIHRKGHSNTFVPMLPHTYIIIPEEEVVP